MSLNDFLEVLRSSKIVSRVVSTKFDAVSDSYVLKVRVELVNGWFMDCWEHKTPRLRRYSYHVFSGKRMVVRWDNSPHYAGFGSFPHHKHEGKVVVEAEDMNLVKVLRELEKTMEKQ